MVPIAVMPVHDPDGMLLSRLPELGPDLQELFSAIVVGLSALTVLEQPEIVDQLRQSDYFRVHLHGHSMPVGAEFRALYTLAAASFPPEQHLHLCFPDRVAFALGSDHRAEFLADIAAVQERDAPLLFQRSEAAWQSHPDNYRQLEGMVTAVGSLLFGRALDFAWCHLVVTAGQLAAVLPKTGRRDMSFLAEIVVQLSDEIKIREVDWLAWEDPYIHGRDPQEMKAEQEANPAEIHKRLSYVVPMLDVLYQAAAGL